MEKKTPEQIKAEKAAQRVAFKEGVRNAEDGGGDDESGLAEDVHDVQVRLKAAEAANGALADRLKAAEDAAAALLARVVALETPKPAAAA